MTYSYEDHDVAVGDELEHESPIWGMGRVRVMSADDSRVTRALLVDDHVAFADALALALNMTPDLKCVASSSDSSSVEELLRVTGARLLISDQHLAEETTGVALIASLKAAHPRLLTVLLTGFPTPGVLSEAAEFGITVLSKSMPITEIVTSLREVVKGRRPAGELLPAQGELLSPSERQVLELLGQGHRVATIAEMLSISIHTVRDHVKAVLRKLDASSQLEAVITAQRAGLIPPPT